MHRAPIISSALAAALLAFMVPLGAGVQSDCRPGTGEPVPHARCPADQAFLDAVRLFREQRWAFAYGRFMTLAGEGDEDAARIALFMHRYGPVLFDTHWDASTDELEEWTSLARSERGRPAPQFTPQRYERDAPGRNPDRARVVRPVSGAPR